MNILITHGYSDSNKGDLAITLGTYKFIRDKFPNARIKLHLVFKKDNKNFQYHNRFKAHEEVAIEQGVLPIPYPTSSKSKRKDIWEGMQFLKDVFQLKVSLLSSFLGKYIGGAHHKAIQDYKKADLIIVKGGQFILNDKETFRENLFLWRIVQPLKIAHHFKKRILILGHSFGGFASEKSERKAIEYLNYCDEIFVREKVSFEFIEKYGLFDKAKLIPDLAFYLKKQFKRNNIELTADIPEKCFGVTVVNWSFPESKFPKEAKKDYILNLQESIEFVYRKYKLIPVFIPQVTVIHHGDSDIDIIKQLLENLNKKNIPAHFLNQDLSVDEMMKVYSKCKFLIGTRLHSCILAANVETPIIAIRYQGYKTQGVMNELGFGNLLLDIHTLKSPDLNNLIDYTFENYQFVKDTLKRKTDSFLKLFSNIDLS